MLKAKIKIKSSHPFMKTMDLVLQDGWLLFHHGGGGGGGGSGPDCGLPGAGRLSVSVPGELWNVMEHHDDAFKDSGTLGPA